MNKEIQIEGVGKRPIVANIGDIVRVTDVGCSYSCYYNAFEIMQGKSYKFSNTQITPSTLNGSKCNLHLYFPPRLHSIQFLKRNNWTVLDMCCHADGCTIVYLLGCATYHIGLMMESDGFEVIRHQNKVINKLYYKAE